MALAGIGDVVEGVHAVAAALDAGRVRRLFVESHRIRALQHLIEQAEAQGVAVVVVEQLERTLTDAAQGVQAEAVPLPWASLEEAADAAEPPALLVLDHWEDPRNVGAAIRSAVAAGVPGIVLAGRRAAPLSATALKAAAGAVEHAVVAQVSSVANALRWLRSRGVWLVGLDGDGDDVLWDCRLLTEPCALVVGREGRGLGRLTADLVDVRVRIPQSPHIESLNASVAASLAVFEMARHRRQA